MTTAKSNGSDKAKNVIATVVVTIVLTVIGWMRADVWRMEERVSAQIVQEISVVRDEERHKDDRIFLQLQKMNERLDRMSEK